MPNPVQLEPRGRVLIVYAGGTIGMVHTDAGLRPEAGFLESYLASMPELSSPHMPPHDLIRMDPLLDSADMVPSDWERIAKVIADNHDRYAGFVVLHGTDTMAYSASALSFLLRGIARPVILTGAQLSLAELRSDGREHVITSLMIAGCLDIPEVAIYFGSRLLRGNRAQKVRNHDFVAFESGNVLPLAHVGVRIDVDWNAVRPGRARSPGRVALVRHPEVGAVRIFPGIRAETLSRLLEPPMEGVVLETYGAGNFPSRDQALLDVVEAAVERGVVVVNCSQCHSGRVDQALYATGRGLSSIGVVSGGDMTPEAALTKLYCLLGTDHDATRTRQLMATDLAGELTVGETSRPGWSIESQPVSDRGLAPPPITGSTGPGAPRGSTSA